MLSLSELRRAVQIIREKTAGAALRRIVQPDPLKLVLTFEGLKGKQHLLLCASPDNARICLTDRAETGDAPGSFYEYAKAHLVGCTLETIECAENNRQACLRLRSRDGACAMVLSILGSRSNLYLLDAGNRLVHSMRSLEDTRNELSMGSAWIPPRGAAPSSGEDRWADVPDDQYLETMDQAYRQLEARNKAEGLARRIRQAVKKERAFLDRKAINLREDLGEALQAEAYKRKGELLKSVLHSVRHGQDKAAATDYQTGEVVEIPLDPKLSPAANLEAYFTRYQKQSRGAEMIRNQIGDLEAAQSRLDSIERKLEDVLRRESPDVGELENMESSPEIRRVLHRDASRRKAEPPAIQVSKQKDVPGRLLPKRYRTQDGLEIWVGRSDEGNDYLTTRLARGNDLFFHLEGYPGSHVVLRTEGRVDAPPESILDACELAAHFSKLKNAGTVDIHVAPIKDVKKPKGAKPGLVYVRKGRTIRLKRNPKRLQNILVSRLDAF